MKGFFDVEAEYFDTGGVREMELKSNQAMGPVNSFRAASVPIAGVKHADHQNRDMLGKDLHIPDDGEQVFHGMMGKHPA